MEWEPGDLSWLPEESQRLLRFACTRMVHSYKPVLTGVLLDRLPELRVPLAEVQDAFVAFYLQREEAGLPVERRGTLLMLGESVAPEAARSTAKNVLRLVFQANGYAKLGRGMVVLCPSAAWGGLAMEPALSSARSSLREALNGFYERMQLQGEAVYGQASRDRAADAHEMVFLLPGPDDPDDLFIL